MVRIYLKKPSPEQQLVIDETRAAMDKVGDFCDQFELQYTYENRLTRKESHWTFEVHAPFYRKLEFTLERTDSCVLWALRRILFELRAWVTEHEIN